jgi:hypothetical protein
MLEFLKNAVKLALLEKNRQKVHDFITRNVVHWVSGPDNNSCGRNNATKLIHFIGF